MELKVGMKAKNGNKDIVTIYDIIGSTVYLKHLDGTSSKHENSGFLQSHFRRNLLGSRWIISFRCNKHRRIA